jgi:hypothetical protein
MKALIRFFLIASLIPVLTTCSKIVYITKGSDPEIILQNGHQEIVFINFFDYTNPVNVKKKDMGSFQAGVAGFMEGLYTSSYDSSFSFLIGDTLKKASVTGLLTTLLPEDTINAICNRYTTDYLLALDSISISFDWEITGNKNFDGINKTKDIYLNTRYFLSLYSSTGDLINRSEVDKSTLYRSRPTLYGFITVEPSIAKAWLAAGRLSYQAAKDYVEKFYPHKEQITEQLYTGKPFKESNDYIFAKNWNQAIGLLEQLSKSQDQSIAEKARHNLEIVREASEEDRK